MDHLLIFCLLANSLWVPMLQLFGIQWVMLCFVADSLFGWQQWLRKCNSNIWNLVPGCLMWIIWTKHNWYSFEDAEKSLAQLIILSQWILLHWSRCCGLSNCSSLNDFVLAQHSPLVLYFLCCFLFIIVNTLYSFFYFFFNNIIFLPIKKSLLSDCLLLVGQLQGHVTK